MLANFESLDAEGTGELTLKQIKEMLGPNGLPAVGLTKAQIGTVMMEAEANAEGKVKYSVFAPVAAMIVYRRAVFSKRKAVVSHTSLEVVTVQ